MPTLLQKLPPTSTLATFECAARLLSFTRAGAELNISQAAVSKQIQRLEADLNIALFERQHRSLQLTRAGHSLFVAVQSGLTEIAKTTEQLRVRAMDEPVTIGLSVAMATYCLMPKLAEFRARFPSIDVRVLAVDRELNVQEEGVDIAIGYAQNNRIPTGGVKLYDEVTLPVCSADYLSTKVVDSIDTLAAATLLHLDPQHWQDLPEAAIDWPQWLSHFGAAHPPTPQGLLINNYVMVLQAALDGQGIALGWRPIVDRLLDNGQLVTTTDKTWQTGRCHYLITASQSPRPPVKTLRDWLLDQLFPVKN